MHEFVFTSCLAAKGDGGHDCNKSTKYVHFAGFCDRFPCLIVGIDGLGHTEQPRSSLGDGVGPLGQD